MKKIITILFTLALAFTMVACGGKKVDIKKDKELLIEELTGIKYDKGIILEGSYSLKSLTTDLVKNEVIGEATTKIALTTDAKTSILNIDMNMPTYGVDTKYNYYILENGKMYMDSKSNMFGEVIEEKVELEDIDDVEYGDILSEISTDFSIDEYLKDAELLKVLMELDALKIYKQDEKLIIEFKIIK